ncbi:YraN family protein [Acidisoma sp.]|uniref:YraN family protein n=1 Tax=Acidisoma sp. TaxID=1872115 RepID=UPI003B0076C6
MNEPASIQRKAARGRRAQRSGIDGESKVALALATSGWTIHGRRMRTAAGEIDIAAERDGLLALIEVKTRRDLDTAAYALGERQRRRLCQAAAILQGENPSWGQAGTRFDAWLVDAKGHMRHVPDAFRDEG